MALGEPLPLEVAERVAPTEVLASLEEADLVHVDGQIGRGVLRPGPSALRRGRPRPGRAGLPAPARRRPGRRLCGRGPAAGPGRGRADRPVAPRGRSAGLAGRAARGGCAGQPRLCP
uniref:Uncharacterized protein n=1 Tax=Janibacter limosus TaxID=53458 RepID=A0AC61U780_9MICO|nr:hypothetical protein [Janibacter limosus]